MMANIFSKLSAKTALRVAAAAGLGLGLSGCVYDAGVGLGYASDGYSSGYDCDPYSPFDSYYSCDYGNGFSNIGYGGGWYNNYYYPGHGFFLFDSYGRRFDMHRDYQRYWGQRRHEWNRGRGHSGYRGGNGYEGHSGGRYGDGRNPRGHRDGYSNGDGRGYGNGDGRDHGRDQNTNRNDGFGAVLRRTRGNEGDYQPARGDGNMGGRVERGMRGQSTGRMTVPAGGTQVQETRAVPAPRQERFEPAPRQERSAPVERQERVAPAQRQTRSGGFGKVLRQAGNSDD